MATLPKQTSEAFKRLNPSLFAKEVMPMNSQSDEIARIPCPEMLGKVGANSSTRQFTIHTEPVPAPRMTKRDVYRVTAKYPRRPCVQRYFDYKETIQRAVGDIPIVPDEIHAVFHLSMPDSWSKKKRQDMEGKPHRQKPDFDNLAKSILDSLFLQDGGVWKGTFEKRWAVHGRVELLMVWMPTLEQQR